MNSVNLTSSQISELARLNSSFFKQKPNFSFWEQIKSVANWSASMIPLLEWDGVVFIGCTEPNYDVNWSFPVQYILADAHDLESYWQKLQTNQKPVIAEETAPPPIPTEEPAGLNLEKFSKINTPKSEDYMDALAQKISKNASPVDLDAPANLNWTPSPKTTDSAIAPEGLAPEESTPEESAPEVVAPVTINIKQKLNQIPNQNLSSDYAPILFEMKNYFDGSLIMSVENDLARAVAWDEPFTPVGDALSKKWSLNSPSALRIAYRTKQPYLGHIVETPTNLEFFNYFGHKELPKNVLIQPVVENNQVTHLIVSTVGASRKNHQTLHEGKTYSEKISNLSSKKHAA